MRDGTVTFGDETYTVMPGDIVQVCASPRPGLIGALIIVEEVKDWGVVGYAHMIQTFDKSSQMFLRPEWSEIEFVGSAEMVIPSTYKAMDVGKDLVQVIIPPPEVKI